MSRLCIYHSRDLDGWMSAAIVKLKYPEAKLVGYNYNEALPEEINSKQEIILVDISFSIEVMRHLQINHHITWIDHHISAMQDAINNSYFSLLGSRDASKAACELTWEYYFPYDKMPEIVRLLGRYDCFGHKGTHEEHKVLIFQYYSRSFMTDIDSCYKNLISWDDSNITDAILSGEAIYSYLCVEAKQIYATLFVIVLDGHYFACVTQRRFNPINFGIDYHKDGYAGFACCWYENDRWNYSLYNDDGKVDCSLIAKKRGGGGHKGAAGFLSDTFIK